ncbi:MAG TPA: type II secretion system protein [Candidatus Xenobia bacterium]|nr:type II secretion system protein [Candidatus Xenobia bacterium]
MRVEKRRATEAGFSLIELLIVVAVILVITAIAIPNFLQARMAANETSAGATMRTLNTVFHTYSSTYQNGFPAALDNLGPGPGGSSSCDQAGLIDSDLATTHIKSGYWFTYAPGPALPAPGVGCTTAGVGDFQLNADPGPGGADRGRTGRKSFYMDTSGVIRYNMIAPAGPTDSPIPVG